MNHFFQVDSAVVGRQKRFSKRRHPPKPIPEELAGFPEMAKYWNQRYRLFSRYDDGILLDRESW